jgi:hypothetical protein
MKHDDASQCELVHIPAGLLHRRLVHPPPPTAKRRGALRQFEPACVPGSPALRATTRFSAAQQNPDRLDVAARLPWRERNHPLWWGVGDGKG